MGTQVYTGGVGVGVTPCLLEFSTMKGRMVHVLLAAAVAISVLARFYESFPGDVPLLRWVQSWQRPVTTAFMEAMSLIGRSWALFGLAGVVTSALFVVHRRREGFAAMGTLAVLGLTPLLQLLVDRPRPPADLVGIAAPFGGFGFPSGHGYQSLVLFGFLIYLVAIFVSRTWLRRSVQAFLVFLILAIGVSRVYLGAHWPSDILGAYLLAARPRII